MKKNAIIITASILLIVSMVYIFTRSKGIKEIEEAKKENEIVLIDFYGDGCPPCRKVSPIIDEIALEYPMIEVLKININSEDGLGEKYNIQYIPTVILFKCGEEVIRLIGFHEKGEYVSHIECLLYPDESVMMKFE